MNPLTLAGAAIAALTLGSAAGAQAQTWAVNGGTYTLNGCAPAEGSVQCDLTFLQTVEGTGGTYQLEPRNVQAFSDTGRLTRATRVNVGGQGFMGPNTAPSTQGVPIDIVFDLGDLPAGTKSIRALIIEGHKLDNVPVASSAAGATPPLAQPPLSQAPVPQNPVPQSPVPQRPMPRTPGRQNMGVPGGFAIPGGFSVQFSDCKLTQGTLTCTATFTPTH